MATKRLGLLSAALLLIAASCSYPALAQTKNSPAISPATHYFIGKPYQFDGVWYQPAVDYAYDETGIASVYSSSHSGLKTTSGETYDDNAVTGAHKTLPLPSIVRVTNLENGKAIELRVNDRGPFVDSQIIEVSRQAAQLLGMLSGGTARVRVQVMAAESRALAAALGGGEVVPAAIAAPAPIVNVTSLPLLTGPAIQPLRPVASPSPAPILPSASALPTTTPASAPAAATAAMAVSLASALPAATAPAAVAAAPAATSTAAAPVAATTSWAPASATAPAAVTAPSAAMAAPATSAAALPATALSTTTATAAAIPANAPTTAATQSPTPPAAAPINMTLIKPVTATSPLPSQPSMPPATQVPQGSGSAAAVMVTNGEEPATANSAPSPSSSATGPAKSTAVAALPVVDVPPPATNTVSAKPIPVELPAHFFIQTGAFKGVAEADHLRAQLAAMGETKIVPTRLGDEEYNAVLLGPISSMAAAEGYLKQIVAMGHPDAVLIIQ